MISRKERVEQLRAQLTPELRARVDQVLRNPRAQIDKEPTKEPSPAVTPDPVHRYDPFPLTELQEAYWVGRSSGIELGNLACFVYIETDATDLDLPRLSEALGRLIERHDMLRMVVLREGQQQILRAVPPYEIAVRDLRGAADRDAQLLRIREELSHQVLPTDRWPLFAISATRVDERVFRLHIGFDTLTGDAWGLRLALSELGKLYQDLNVRLPPLTLSFRDYVLAEVADRQGAAYARALSYWQQRLPALPPAPALPLARPVEELTHPRFGRRCFWLPQELWARLRAHAGEHGLTPTQALLSAYAEVLGRFSASQRFTLNVPLFNRLPLHPEVNRILGEFASMTLIEVDRTERLPFCERATRLKAQLMQALDHSRVHGVRLLRELTRLRGRRELMPVVFTSILSLEGLDFPSALENWFGEIVFEITQTPQVWLDLQIFGDGGALRVQLDAIEDLFPDGLLDAFKDALSRLLSTLAEDASAWKREALDIVPAPPMTPARTSAAHLELAHQGLCGQVEQRAAAPAVITPGRALSFRELHSAALYVAAALRDSGITPGSPVAIAMEKGWEQVAAALGVLLAGAAYVPIDPQSPMDRQNRILAQIGAAQILTQPHIGREATWPPGVARITLTEEALAATPTELAAAESAVPTTASGASGRDLAYVLFTSGSTGAPKGVMIEHRGVAQAIAATNERFAIGPNDRVLGLTALHHDMSVYDMLGVTAAGGAVVLPPPEAVRDPARWVELIQEHAITVWNSVPAFMEMLLEYAASRPGLTLPSLRLVFLGGDFIAVDLAERLRRVAPFARLVSVGGPTETTLWNIWYEVERTDPAWKSIPYGRPIPGVRYLVLNENLEMCPVGVPGELCCAGVGLARGYWGEPELTAERFVTDPASGERIYRTGDLGRLLPDGNLEILGRTDFQVKILGHRVEAGEIEAALLRHPAVRAAVVVGHGPRGRQRLAAYVVPRDGSAPPREEELRQHLARLLPQHMVPGTITALAELPLSANGKVDRRALLEVPSPAPAPAPAPSPAPPAGAGYSDTVVADLAAITAGLLGVASLDPDMDLMTAGVDSVTLVRLTNQIESRFGFRPPPADLFRAPTVRSIARLIQAGVAAPAPHPPTALGAGVASKYELIIEPTERAAFRQKQLGVRADTGAAGIDLSGPPVDEELLSRYAARRSHRRFSLRLVGREALGSLLSNLRQASIGGAPKYLYPSGGGLYGVQLYLHIKRGRVEDTPGGVYYYHPVRHQLIALSKDAEIQRDIHVPFINQPVFDEAALSLFFIAQLDAIGPLYGDYSVHHATLEAGIMAQLLDASAPRLGIGLCHIGHIEFEPIRPLFRLDPSHVLIHSMVGGSPEEAAKVASDPKPAVSSADRAERLREQIKRLSPDEVKRMLAARRGEGKADSRAADGDGTPRDSRAVIRTDEGENE
jgi:amino acid adenylation domain-containing protein